MRGGVDLGMQVLTHLPHAHVHRGVGGYGLGTLVAGVAAVLFAIGSVVQQEQASAATSGGGRVHMRALVRRPAWLAAQGATVGATAAQVAALALAPVSIVQPVLAGGLVVALGLRSARDHRWPTRAEVGGAVCTAGGLAVFLVAARPAVGVPQVLPGAAGVWAAVAVAVAVVALASRARSGAAAVLSGVAAGLATGIAAVLISTALKVLSLNGVLHALASASLWGAVVVAALAQYASQQAFARGSLSLSLPALTVVDPLAAVPAARFLLGEHLQPGYTAIWLPAAALAAVGVVILSRAGTPTSDAEQGSARSSSPPPAAS
jgi:hypothetical protein